MLAIVASNLVPTSLASPDRAIQAAPNAAPLNVGAPEGGAPAANDQRPAGGPVLPERAAGRAKGIMRTGTIPAGPLGAESVDSGDGDVSCGKTECGP